MHTAQLCTLHEHVHGALEFFKNKPVLVRDLLSRSMCVTPFGARSDKVLKVELSQ